MKPNNPLLYRLFTVLFGVLCSCVAIAQSTGFRINVPYTEEFGKIVIDVLVNQVKGRFLVDTGAPCCVSHAFAQKAGVATQGQEVTVSDSNGQEMISHVVTLDALHFGGNVTFNALEAIVWEEGNLLESFGVDGIIGYNLFRRGILGFDSMNHRLMFTNDDSGLDAMAERFAVPLVPDYFLTLVELPLGTSACDTVMFDSGAESFYELSTQSYHRLAAQPDSCMQLLGTGKGVLSLGVAGIEQGSRKHRVCFPQMRLGGQTFRRVTSITTDATNSRLGTALLRYGRVIIDYPQGRFFFIPYQPNITPDLYEREWDIVFTSYDNRLYAGLVWDGTDLPLQGGEQIVEVNGLNTETIDTHKAISTALLPLEGDAAEIVFLTPEGERQRATIRRR